MVEVKTVDGAEYVRIAWPDVRAGDVLMHVNGDRLKVTFVSSDVGEMFVSGIWRREVSLRGHGFSPHRKVEQVPTEPGAYSDRDGNPWMYDEAGDWNDRAGGFYPREAPRVQAAAPFTRLVPMPTSDAVMEVVQRAEPMCGRERITDAVMALLRGGDDA